MRRREILTPDLTPLIDVVFILLIFFIVSSVFKKDELALVLNLPSSAAQEVDDKPKEIIIELNKKRLALSGKVVTIDAFKQKMKSINNKDQNIIFRIDKEVTYNKIIPILDTLQQNKLFNLSLITNDLD